MHVNGILLEGVDFVGKTSVAIRLVDLLIGRGVSARLGKCYLMRASVTDFLEARAKEHSSMLERDWYYTAALLADLALIEPEECFVVQDRHWLTQVGRNLYFHRPIDLVVPGTIERLHKPFRFNVFLRCDLETKLRRSRSRPPNSPRDEYLAANPSRHQDYEDFVISLLPPHEPWTIVDTSNLSIEEVAESLAQQVAGHSAALCAQ